MFENSANDTIHTGFVRMRSRHVCLSKVVPAVIVGALSTRVLGADVLRTQGFSSCLDNSTIQVDKLNVEYDRSAGVVTFDVAGTSSKSQNVTASLTVNAYGRQVYKKDFDPCSPKIDQLCPGMCMMSFGRLVVLKGET